MQSIPTELIDHFLRGTAALFIGSDLPSTVTDLPSRADLAEELAKREGLPGGRAFSETAELVVGPYNQRNPLINFLLEKLDSTGMHPSRLHQLVAQLPTEMIITTAYDDLLEQAFRQIGQPYDTIVTPSNIGLANRPGRVTIVYLYGKLRGDLDQLILTKSDHIGMSFRPKKAPLFDLVRHVFQTRAVFFLGYNLSDPDFELMYSQVLEGMKPFHIGTWAISLPMEVRYRELWASKGIRNIETDPLDALEKLLDSKKKFPTPSDPTATISVPSEIETRDSLSSPPSSNRSTVEGTQPISNLQIIHPTSPTPPNNSATTPPSTASELIAPKIILGLAFAFSVPLILFLAAFSLAAFIVPSQMGLALIFAASILATVLVSVAVLATARVVAPEQTKELISQIIGILPGLWGQKGNSR